MTDDSIQHELGVLSGTIAGLSDNISKQNKTIEKIFDKIDELPGICPTGRQNAKDIADLQKRPSQIVAMCAAAASVMSMIGSTIWGVWILLRGH